MSSVNNIVDNIFLHEFQNRRINTIFERSSTSICMGLFKKIIFTTSGKLIMHNKIQISCMHRVILKKTHPFQFSQCNDRINQKGVISEVISES